MNSSETTSGQRRVHKLVFSGKMRDHDYVMEASMANQTKQKDVGSAPVTLNKPPAGKKSKGQHDEMEVSNLTILEDIRGM